MKAEALSLGGKVLISQCWVAKTFFSRLMGLMGRKSIHSDEAILFPRCNSIHTFFMRVPIDVIFVGRDGSVIEVLESLGQWRMTLPRLKAKHVIELKAKRSRELGVSVGAKLQCDEVFH